MLMMNAVPHVIIFFEQRVVLHRPLLEFHINAATVDTDNAPYTTVRVWGREKWREKKVHKEV